MLDKDKTARFIIKAILYPIMVVKVSIYFVLSFLFIIFLGWLLSSCCPDKKELEIEYVNINPDVIWCIHGWQYWYLGSSDHRLAIRLDDDGKPVKCKVEKGK